MPMPFRPALLLAALLPGIAAAQGVCPTVADLPTGISVTYDHGGTDIFRSDPARPGAVVWQGEFEGTSLGTAVLAEGWAYLTTVSPASGGEEVRYDYDIAPPRPEPGTTWEAVATVSTGGTDSTERLRAAFGALRRLRLGDCVLGVIPITIDYAESREELFWYAELGISVRAGDIVTGLAALR